MTFRWECFAPGLARENSSATAWALVTLRKAGSCRVCTRSIPAGAEAYRPLTEGGGVMRCDRACVRCVETAT